MDENLNRSLNLLDVRICARRRRFDSALLSDRQSIEHIRGTLMAFKQIPGQSVEKIVNLL
jgi:hypothetical protein